MANAHLPCALAVATGHEHAWAVGPVGPPDDGDRHVVPHDPARSMRKVHRSVQLVHAQVEEARRDIGSRSVRCRSRAVGREHDLRIVTANDGHTVLGLRGGAEKLHDEWFEQLMLQPVSIEHDENDASGTAGIRKDCQRSSALDPAQAWDADDERRRSRVDRVGHEER